MELSSSFVVVWLVKCPLTDAPVEPIAPREAGVSQEESPLSYKGVKRIKQTHQEGAILVERRLGNLLEDKEGRSQLY